MPFAFACRSFAIVTGEAIALDFRVVNMHIAECRIVMAIGAVVGCLWMIVRFAHCHVAVVATKAGGGHTFEDSAFVALFTGYLDVGTIEREARELVVE